MMTASDLEARVRRLEQLTRGLAKELTRWKEGNDPLLYLERKAYVGALQTGLSGLDAARAVLAEARGRLADEVGAIGEVPGE